MNRAAHKLLRYEDRLVMRWSARDGSSSGAQGKRVGKDCPLNRDEIRAYVSEGAISAVKLIRTRLIAENPRNGLREALNLLNAARGKQHWYDRSIA